MLFMIFTEIGIFKNIQTQSIPCMDISFITKIYLQSLAVQLRIGHSYSITKIHPKFSFPLIRNSINMSPEME